MTRLAREQYSVGHGKALWLSNGQSPRQQKQANRSEILSELHPTLPAEAIGSRRGVVMCFSEYSSSDAYHGPPHRTTMQVTCSAPPAICMVHEQEMNPQELHYLGRSYRRQSLTSGGSMPKRYARMSSSLFFAMTTDSPSS